ncbi:efflux RND transporter periplasmic adaptor subunit [Paenibacillus sacheonensis]|uniref:Biotin/lipoyl-binding protein n=1 Tax=Paenibacillus sacheonensis TaxID=742054 RepID=A0A7X5BY04_9BACL|nr:biotin/lipoyl-binding protein [Paenibacillus sacheonensis]MBM7563648.1 RND family efflux transporter MFP subunit [Paenibacillus sacheonensis]NBC71058.1 biotin/lipoyl-binding protein [Paenibacillus sacheonensis]
MEERTSESRKRKIRLIAGLFLVLLAGCTLAGNSLRALSLPKVYTTVPSTGSLAHDYEGSAAIQPGEARDLMNPAGWKVSKVLVKQGERVHKGQPLVLYDDSDARLELADQQAVLKKLNLSMHQLENDYIEAASGDSASAKAAAANAIETAKLDIASEQRHIEHQQKTIAESRQITAPFDGSVTKVNAAAGLDSGGLPDITVANSAKGYQLQLLVPGETAALFHAGDTLDHITVEEADARTLTGTITTIEEAAAGGLAVTGGEETGVTADMGPTYKLTIVFTDDSLRGGEQVNVKLSKEGGDQLILVPNEAVHKNDRGAYVYTLRAEDGPLGNAYYVVETPIKIADANEYATAVSEGLFERQDIIINSSSFIMDGVRVRL